MWQVQGRGTKGKIGAKLEDTEDGKDEVAQFFTCNDHDTILFITEKGICHSLRTFKVPVAGRNAKGTPLSRVLPLSADEPVCAVLPVTKEEMEAQEETSEGNHLVLVTRRGWIKRTPVSAFAKTSTRGLIAINLDEGDSVQWVRLCTSRQASAPGANAGSGSDPSDGTSSTIMLGTRKGFATHFATSAVRPTGRTSRGVKTMKLRDDDEIVDMDVLPPGAATDPDTSLLIITTRGYGKLTPVSEFTLRNRGGMGVIAIKFKHLLQNHSGRAQIIRFITKQKV